MQNSAILRINAEKEFIDVTPWYQRKGGVWDIQKKQLLIDSILNEFDIPKLYFHALCPPKDNYDFSVIDGRQRLESIWEFMDDKFPLAEDFTSLQNPEIQCGGLKYSDLAIKYPRLKIRFDSFTLPIICVETEEIYLIEEMFSRLNEAVPLNAAEKRNAIGGPMAAIIRDLAEHVFFRCKVKFGDSRYQHRETVTKLIFIEYSLINKRKILDTKKPYLDHMVKKYKNESRDKVQQYIRLTEKILTPLSNVFSNKDQLLRNDGIVPVYYLVTKEAIKYDQLDLVTRKKIESFFDEIAGNKALAEKDIAKADYDLLLFDRLSQQGTSDSLSIVERTRILCNYLRINNLIDRLSKQAPAHREAELCELLSDHMWDLLNDEEIEELMLETDHTDFIPEDFYINNIETSKDEIVVTLSFSFCSEQQPDLKIVGDLIATFYGDQTIEHEIEYIDIEQVT